MEKQMSYFSFVVGIGMIVVLFEASLGNIGVYGKVGYSALFVFLVLSYILEQKWRVNRYWQLGIYTAYCFSVGTFSSLVLAQNSASLALLILYFSLSFIASMIWCALLPGLFAKKKTFIF